MTDRIHVQSHREGTIIDVYVQPRSSRSEIVGPHAGTLRVRVTAPPVEGAANDAIIALLSAELGVRRLEIAIVAGASGRRKRVLVRGLSPEEVLRRLSP
ncbi:MAG TPA: DUF167 domain-containing protein [Thermomicrobiales bacterium]|nr:DUF167 domain-containing protein [Thermomicrobiales bacterium]